MAGQEIQGMLIRLEATTAQLRQEMARADSSVAQVSGRIDRQLAQVDSAFDRLGLSAQRVGGILKGALAIGIGGAGIGALVSQAEAYTTIANRLKLVTSNSAEFTAAQNSVFNIAQKAGQPLGATAELYQRIAQNQDALKLSGKGVAGIVETISKTMVISGASAVSSSAALVQLGQAFASGTLRGEELNSIMEQAPALSQAIAKGMGVSVGALRALGAEGKLTAESVVQALQAQQGAVDALFGKMQDTIGTGLTRVQTSFTKMIGEGDKVGGMSAQISAALTSASRAMDAITDDGDAFAETVKNLGNVLENVAYVGAAALALGTGKMAVSFAQATLASVRQAGALALTTKASLEALTAEAALARQSLLTAQTRQLEAKALVERAGLELAAAEGKIASDRARQASELGNIRLVQGTLAAELELEGVRFKAQFTDKGRQLSVARMAELRIAEAGAIKLVQAAEVSLAATTVATSAEITAALGAQTAARGVLAETTATTNAAIVASDRTAAAAAVGARATTVLSAASGGLLALLSGPVGLIAMTGLVAASFIDFGSSAKTATSALIDQNLTVDDSIAKFKELGAAQRTLQVSTWTEKQTDALDEVGTALNEYSMRGKQAFQQLGMAGIESGEAFDKIMEEVRAGSRSLNSVTEWVKENKAILPAYTTMLEQTAAAYEINGLKADKYGKLLGQVRDTTVAVTSGTEKLKVAQKSSGQTDASKAAWDKYIEQLTKTRDLLGANAAAEAAYTAAKMGATPAQAAQAKLIADQTDTLKKYQDAIKEGDKVQQASLKLQLVALYTAEDATTQAAAEQKKTLDDTAKAAEESATRQVNAMQRIIDQTMRVATGQNMLLVTPPKQNLTGYGLLTNGGTAPSIPATPKATPLDRATAAIAQLDATTEANKRVDKAANAAATALKNQAKALDDLLVKSGISTKSTNEMADAYLSGADNIRAITIQQKIEEELLKTGAGARDKVTAAVNALQDAEDRRDVAKNISELKVEVDQILKQATATLQGKDALEAYNIEKAVTIALSGKKIAVGSEEYKQLLATTNAQLNANKALEQAGQVEGIVDRLNPQIKLLKDFTVEQDALNAAIARYPQNAALYQDALVKLGNEYEVNRSKATLWGQMTEGAIDRIDEAFASAWGNIGSGAESLWDNLKKGFKQTLGEIAHMLTTKPLLASISNWLTGTDNGQGIGSVWSKLLGGASGSSSSSGGGLFGSGNTLVSMGKSIYQAYSAITGVGSSIASGYASGGIGGAISGGVGYYGNLLSSFGSTLSSGFSGIVGAITGSTATQVAANAATSAALQGAVAQGATQVGTSIGIGGAAAAGAGTAAAAGAGAGFYASLAAMASNPVGWVIAAVTSAYQSGKLYDQGVRWNTKDVMNTDLVKYSGGIGQATLAPLAVTNNVLEKIVGGKMAAIFSGSTFASAIITKVSEKIFGGSWQTKDGGISLGVENGELDAQQYIDQKKKGGLFSSSKKRTRYSVLDAQTAESMAAVYDATEQGVIALVSRIGISVNEGMFDGLNIAKRKLSTQGKTGEEIQKLVSDWFSSASDQMVGFLDGGTGGFGYSFAELAQRIASFETFNDTLDTLNIAVLGLSPHSMELANSLIAAAGGMEAFQTATNTYYDNFFSESEKADDVLSAVTKQFAAMGVTLPGTRDAYRGMVEALDMTTASGQSMFMTLTSLAGNAAQAYSILEQRADAAAAAEAEAAAVATAAAKELADALKEALMGSVSSAMSAVQRAISAQQQKATEAYNATNISLNDMVSTVTENVNGLNSVSSSLSAALKALRGDSDDAEKMLRAQAQATLQSALVKARSGGSLSGFTGLNDALDTVSTNNTDLYSSLEDFNREQGRTANVVAELNTINGKQLTSAEKSLKGLETQIDLAKAAYDAQMTALDNQLSYAQAQMDALNGVDTSVLSVVSAIQQMNSAVVAALSGQASGAAMQNTYDNNVKLLRSVYQAVLGRDLDGNGLATWTAALANGSVTYADLAQTIATGGRINGETIMPGYATGGLISGPGTGTSDSIYARLSNGEYVMSADAVRMFGTGLLDQMNAGLLPAFANGGAIGETGPQLQVTSPSRIYNANQAGSMSGGNSNAGLVVEIRALGARLDMIQAETKAGALNGGKIVKLLDRVTDGGNAMLTKELA